MFFEVDFILLKLICTGVQLKKREKNIIKNRQKHFCFEKSKKSFFEEVY